MPLTYDSNTLQTIPEFQLSGYSFFDAIAVPVGILKTQQFSGFPADLNHWVTHAERVEDPRVTQVCI